MKDEVTARKEAIWGLDTIFHNVPAEGKLQLLEFGTSHPFITGLTVDNSDVVGLLISAIYI